MAVRDYSYTSKISKGVIIRHLVQHEADVNQMIPYYKDGENIEAPLLVIMCHENDVNLEMLTFLVAGEAHVNAVLPLWPY